MKRHATQTIWRTVVFAGAMLGAPACSKKKPPATPTNTQTDTAQPTTTNDTTPQSADPCAGDGRIRGSDEDGGGGVGRGFILS